MLAVRSSANPCDIVLFFDYLVSLLVYPKFEVSLAVLSVTFSKPFGYIPRGARDKTAHMAFDHHYRVPVKGICAHDVRIRGFQEVIYYLWIWEGATR